MKILKNLEIVDLGIRYKDILVIGDLHLGLEGSLDGEGLVLPLYQVDIIIERLEKIIKKIKPKVIIVNGDVKEEFGRISKQEWKDFSRFVDFLGDKAGLIFIKGNHDVILKPLARKFDIEVRDRFDIDDISIIHGDVILKNLRKKVIISHEHPAISFSEKPGELFKCFLVGKYKKHDLVVLPSSNPLCEGFDITRERLLSLFLKDLGNFDVYIVQDKVYHFGKFKKIQKL